MVALSRCLGSLILLLTGAEGARAPKKVLKQVSDDDAQTKFTADVPVLKYHKESERELSLASDGVEGARAPPEKVLKQVSDDDGQTKSIAEVPVLNHHKEYDRESSLATDGKQALAWIPNTMESACKDNWEFSGDGLTLTLLQANTANQCIHAHATLPQSQGRWYVEIRIDALFPISRPGGQTSVLVGIGLCAGVGDQCDGWLMLYDYDYWAPHPHLSLKPPGGQLISPYPSYASATSGRWNQGDVIGIAFDANAGTLEYYVNGVGQGEVQSFFPGFLFAGEWHIAIRDGTRSANGIVLSLLRVPEFAIPNGFTYWQATTPDPCEINSLSCECFAHRDSNFCDTCPDCGKCVEFCF